MSTSCSVIVKGKAGHWTYEVHCGRKIVACGHRSTHALAETAGAREMAVYASVASGKRRSGGGGATALEYGDDYVGGGGARVSGGRDWKFKVVKMQRGMQGKWFAHPTAATFDSESSAREYANKFALNQRGVHGTVICVLRRDGSFVCEFAPGA